MDRTTAEESAIVRNAADSRPGHFLSACRKFHCTLSSEFLLESNQVLGPCTCAPPVISSRGKHASVLRPGVEFRAVEPRAAAERGGVDPFDRRAVVRTRSALVVDAVEVQNQARLHVVADVEVRRRAVALGHFVAPGETAVRAVRRGRKGVGVHVVNLGEGNRARGRVHRLEQIALERPREAVFGHRRWRCDGLGARAAHEPAARLARRAFVRRAHRHEVLLRGLAPPAAEADVVEFAVARDLLVREDAVVHAQTVAAPRQLARCSVVARAAEEVFSIADGVGGAVERHGRRDAAVAQRRGGSIDIGRGEHAVPVADCRARIGAHLVLLEDEVGALVLGEQLEFVALYAEVGGIRHVLACGDHVVADLHGGLVGERDGRRLEVAAASEDVRLVAPGARAFRVAVHFARRRAAGRAEVGPRRRVHAVLRREAGVTYGVEVEKESVRHVAVCVVGQHAVRHLPVPS